MQLNIGIMESVLDLSLFFQLLGAMATHSLGPGTSDHTRSDYIAMEYRLPGLQISGRTGPAIPRVHR